MEAGEEDSSICLHGLVKVEFVGYRVCFFFFLCVCFSFLPPPPSTLLLLLTIFLFQVQKLTKSEVLMVNIGSLSTGGRVSAVRADLAKIALTQPVCTEVGEKIALSRRVEKHWR